MDNKNLTLKWTYTLGNNKIVFERGIIDGTKNRWIYGIFIIDNKQQTKYCAYVGKQPISIKDFRQAMMHILLNLENDYYEMIR